jgi:hypothetical protein
MVMLNDFMLSVIVLNVIMLQVHDAELMSRFFMLSVSMLGALFGVELSCMALFWMPFRSYAWYCFSEYLSAVRHFIVIILNVIILSVFILLILSIAQLSVFMFSTIMLIVGMLCFVMLSIIIVCVFILIVMAPFVMNGFVLHRKKCKTS